MCFILFRASFYRLEQLSNAIKKLREFKSQMAERKVFAVKSLNDLRQTVAGKNLKAFNIFYERRNKRKKVIHRNKNLKKKKLFG